MEKTTYHIQEAHDLITEFRSALTEEIEFIKKEGGGHKFTARDGQLLENRDTKFIYQFIIDDPAGLPDDVPVQIRYGRDNVQGSIIAIEGVMILVALDQNIGTKVTEVTIIADPYYLLEILNKRLEEVQNRKLLINVPLVEKLFSLAPCNNGENFEYPIQPGYQLNDSQRDAIAKALGSDISFIWGPPGTGKTTTLAALAEILFNQGMSILILSHTNVAVDNAIEKISEYMKKHGNKELLEGKVLRLGNAQEGFFQKHPEVWLDHWIGEKSNELRKNRGLLEKVLLEYESERSEKNKVLQLYSDIDKLRTTIDNNKELYRLAMQERNQAESNLKELRNSSESLEGKIIEATKMSKIRRLFAGISLEKLHRRKEELEKSLSMCETKAKSAEQKVTVIERELKEQISKLEELDKLLSQATSAMEIIIRCENPDCNQRLIIEPLKAKKGIVTCPTCDHKFEHSGREDYVSEKRLKRDVDDLDSWIDTLKDNIRDIDARLERIEGEILKDVKLLATTLTKGYTESDIYNRRFDVVIVDESSMAPLPMLFFDCGLATQKIIVIGDFRQLAPIARSDAEIVNRWLKTDIFDFAGIITEVENGTKCDKLVQLVEQHRMHSSIMAVVNEPIYDGNLKAGQKAPEALEKETKTVAAQPFEGQNIIICDTSTFNPWCSMTSNGSPFNIYSAFLSLYLGEQALNSGINGIAIISPYAAQTRLLHKLVTDKLATDKRYKDIDPSSVHRFQGKERELIILDLVEGPVRQIRWLGSEDRKTDAGRLINVAVTRAKSKLIIVANLSYLDKKLSGNSILKKILFSIRNNHPIVDANTFFDFIPGAFDIEKMIDTEKLLVDDVDIDERNYFFSQAYFYPYFYRDLQNCKKEVIIFSPFVTKRRTDSFVNYFRGLLSNGIRVILITRPSREQISFIQESVDEILDYLKNCGVEVIQKRKMHEKLAIIDKKIIWQGSLNILSHKNTTELMTRIKTQQTQTAEEILKLFGINIDRIREEEKLKSRIRTLNEKGFGICPNCGSKMLVRRGRFGLFLSCESYRSGCKETMQVDERIIEAIYGGDYLRCECGARMKIKYNPKRRSRFLACPNYPKHKFTRPI